MWKSLSFIPKLLKTPNGFVPFGFKKYPPRSRENQRARRENQRARKEYGNPFGPGNCGFFPCNPYGPVAPNAPPCAPSVSTRLTVDQILELVSIAIAAAGIGLTYWLWFNGVRSISKKSEEVRQEMKQELNKTRSLIQALRLGANK